MTNPNFGLIFDRQDTDPLPPIYADLSVLGFLSTSEDADPAVFPLNTAVDINTGDVAALTGAGTGDLRHAFDAVNDQLAQFQASARAVVVRVAKGVDDFATISNLLGDSAARTGLYAFLNAPQALGVTPRLFAIPNYTWQQASGVNAIAIGAGGSGFTSAPTVGFSGGGGTGAAGTAVLTQGVGAITLGVGGTGYSTAPTVTLSAPDQPGGVQATATATVASGAVTGFNVTNKGSGYTSAPTVSFGGPGTGATATASLTGIVKSVTITNPGTGYTSAPTLALTGGGGTGSTATATVGVLNNALLAAAPAVMTQLLGDLVWSTGPLSKTAAAALRNLQNSDRLIAVSNRAVWANGSGTRLADTTAIQLGLQVATDFEHGGFPFWTAANRPAQGILGLERYDSFSLTDGATDGQILLASNIGVIERGEASDTAISSNGFIMIATDNCGDSELWRFYNQTRGRDFTHLALLKSIRKRIGRENVSPHGVQAVLNDMIVVGSDLKKRECTIGFRVDFLKSANSPEDLRAGKFRVEYAQEEPAPIKQVTVGSRRYRVALDLELDLLVQQASELVG